MNSNSSHVIVGNLGSNPELRFTPSGTPVSTLNVGVSERKRNPQTEEWEDTETSWFRVIAWGKTGEYVAASLFRGMRVMVIGTMRQRSYTSSEGEKRTVWELTADDIGPSLRYTPVSAKRASTDAKPDPWEGVDATPERPKPEPETRGSESDGEPATAGAAQPATEPANGSQSGREPVTEPATADAGTGARKRSRRAPDGHATA